MSNVPSELKYSKDHEWIQANDDGTVTVGITDYAQAALGDLVFVEVPETGSTVTTGDACAVIESVKAASDVYSPLSGEIAAVNDGLADAPESVNQDPYGDGWIMKIRVGNETELSDLMNAEAYEQFIADEE